MATDRCKDAFATAPLVPGSEARRRIAQMGLDGAAAVEATRALIDQSVVEPLMVSFAVMVLDVLTENPPQTYPHLRERGAFK